MGDTKDNETYVEAEPDAEYFVRIDVGDGSRVQAWIFVDDKNLGYSLDFTPPEKAQNHVLWSYDGVSTTIKALLFAKAKVFNSSDAAQDAPFWTGNVRVEFSEIFDTGRTDVMAPLQNKWKGGDVGVVVGQAGPKMKGVMTKEGNISISEKDDGRRIIYRQGQILETITLKYCSTIGLMMAGVLGPLDPYDVMARKLHEHKRGADAVTVGAASIPPPKKIRCVQEVDGQSFDGENEKRGRPVSITPS